MLSDVLLILGNGPTKRVTIYGFALEKIQSKKDIVWYCFSTDANEEGTEQPAEYDFDAPISSLQEIDYIVAEVARYKKDHYGVQRRRKAFNIQWEKSMDKIDESEIDVVILEELDGALDAGWLNINEILHLINKGNVKEFIITGNYLPADILGAANKLVEIWEREN